MKSGNKVFTGVLIAGLVIGSGLMIFNSTLFNQITGMEEEAQVPQGVMTAGEKPLGKETVTGVVIAGTTTPYLEFTQEGYEKALQDKKIIVLNFYANWCPICRAEEPDAKAAFDSLDNPDVVGFQVHFKDDLTTPEAKALAEKYSVPYQHTKVILKDGREVLKETAQWSKDEFVTQINAQANN